MKKTTSKRKATKPAPTQHDGTTVDTRKRSAIIADLHECRKRVFDLENAPKPAVYVFVSGGLVTQVRSTLPVSVTVLDYDNADAEGLDDGQYEQKQIGCTYAVLEKQTRQIF